MKIEPTKAPERTVHGMWESAASSGRGAQSATIFPQSRHADLPPMQLGQEIDAQVVSVSADGRVVTLQLGATLIEADSPGGLHPGQALRLRVELIEPRLTLQIVEAEQVSEPTVEGRLTQLIRERLPLANDSFFAGLGPLLKCLQPTGGAASKSGWAKLARFLIQLAPSEGPWTAQQLQRYIRDSGLHFETKLLRAAAANPEALAEIADGDLKGLLLGLLEELAGEGRSSDGATALANKLHDIEGQQAANLLAQADGKALQLRVPLFIGAAMTDVAISVESDGEHGGEKRAGKNTGYRILFALELEDFGPTRIDVALNANDLRAFFYVDGENSLTRLRAALPDLQMLLRGAGYRTIALAAQPLRDLAADQQEKFTALALGVPTDAHLVDVKV